MGPGTKPSRLERFGLAFRKDWTKVLPHCGLFVPGYEQSMAKLSISIDDADLRWVKQRARRLHGGNLSAAIAEGTRILRHNEALGAMLDKLGAPELSPRRARFGRCGARGYAQTEKG